MDAITPDLTEDQSAALAGILAAIEDPEAIVTLAGYAGTGKSYPARSWSNSQGPAGAFSSPLRPTRHSRSCGGAQAPTR